MRLRSGRETELCVACCMYCAALLNPFAKSSLLASALPAAAAVCSSLHIASKYLRDGAQKERSEGRETHSGSLQLASQSALALTRSAVYGVDKAPLPHGHTCVQTGGCQSAGSMSRVQYLQSCELFELTLRGLLLCVNQMIRPTPSSSCRRAPQHCICVDTLQLHTRYIRLQQLTICSMQIGIVGLPNVGKSTTFNLLTKLSIPAENFPFCTIEPNHVRRSNACMTGGVSFCSLHWCSYKSCCSHLRCTLCSTELCVYGRDRMYDQHLRSVACRACYARTSCYTRQLKDRERCRRVSTFQMSASCG